MKITVFHNRFDVVGGVEVLATTQAKIMHQAGHDVGILTYVYDPSLWQERLEGLPLWAQREVGARDDILRRTFGISSRRQQQWSDDFLRRCDAHVVIAHSYPTTARLAESGYAGRKIWYCHEPPRDLHIEFAWPAMAAHQKTREPHHRSDLDGRYRIRRMQRWWADRFQPYLKQRDRNAVKKMEKIWANSEFSRDVCRHVYGRHDVAVLSPMVQFPKHVAARSGLRRHQGLQVLSQSRLNVEKNFGNLLAGFAEFSRNASPRPHLHVVGTGPEEKRLQRWVQRLQLTGLVSFYGYLTPLELQQVYDSCDVFALFPVDEPFGMVFPEAAAQGLLLLGPDHGGPREILDDGRLGICTNVFDPVAIAAAFARVGSMSDTAANDLRRRAEQACRQRYDVAVAGQRLLQLLQA